MKQKTRLFPAKYFILGFGQAPASISPKKDFRFPSPYLTCVSGYTPPHYYIASDIHQIPAPTEPPTLYPH